jgi:hypothetical protein
LVPGCQNVSSKIHVRLDQEISFQWWQLICHCWLRLVVFDFGPNYCFPIAHVGIRTNVYQCTDLSVSFCGALIMELKYLGCVTKILCVTMLYSTNVSSLVVSSVFTFSISPLLVTRRNISLIPFFFLCIA